MARADFIEQLRKLGYSPREMGGNRLAFDYTISVGKFAGREIQLGFAVANDFPLNPPSGPNISPHLLPINPKGKQHPSGGIHANRGFDDDWQYWSRPFPNWAATDKTVKTYLAFIRHLFETQ